MKINSGKSHILFPVNDVVIFNIDNNAITSENKDKLLDIVLDSRFSFEDGINNFYKRASRKLNTLARFAPYMSPEHRKTIMKAFVTYQFGFCYLVWISHNRGLNSKINLHE